MTKITLDVVTTTDAKEKTSDVEVVGNPDLWVLLAKASSANQGWTRSTKAYEVPGSGCIVQVSTQQGDRVAEALVWVPGAAIGTDMNGHAKLYNA